MKGLEMITTRRERVVWAIEDAAYWLLPDRLGTWLANQLSAWKFRRAGGVSVKKWARTEGAKKCAESGRIGTTDTFRVVLSEEEA